jgi:hypothetical protein
MPPLADKAWAANLAPSATDGALHGFGLTRRFWFMATRVKTNPFTKEPKHFT